MTIAKRLTWVRQRLKIGIKEVATGTGIPHTTYWEWENGRSPRDYKDYLVLVAYLDELWNKQYKETFPRFGDIEVRTIGLLWLLFGVEKTQEQVVFSVIEERYKERELELIARIHELERQTRVLRLSLLG